MTWLRVFLATLVALAAATTFAETIVYQNPTDVLIRGEWSDSEDGLFEIVPATFGVDMNSDGALDVQFDHTYVRRTERIDSEGVELLRIAESGLSTSLRVLTGMRDIVIDSANEAVNDELALLANQREIDRGLAAIQSAALQDFEGKVVLNGSFGINAVSDHPNIVDVATTAGTKVGVYDVEITYEGRAARVTADVPQTFALAADELLVINGRLIELEAGMPQSAVISAINSLSPFTSVVADIVQSGETRLSSTNFGAFASIDVISNWEPSSQSTGFATAMLRGQGDDVIALVGDTEYSGDGDTIIAIDGTAEGLSFRVTPDDDPTSTYVGEAGSITVADQSPVFTINEETAESVTIALPNILPATLGRGVERNRFQSLREIKVHSLADSRDALATVDQALDQIRRETVMVREFLTEHAYPYGAGSITALGNVEFSLDENETLFQGGVVVDQSLDFSDGELLLQDSSVFQSLNRTGFLGVRTRATDGWHYGWIGIQIDENSAITISDYAWNTLSNTAVTTGVVPEPTSMALALVAITGMLMLRRRSGSRPSR